MTTVSHHLQRVLRLMDEIVVDCRSQLDVDKLVAARQCIVEPTYTVVRGKRRAFVKWCPKCETAKPFFLFNRNARKKDGLQTVCRDCQRVIYQEHTGHLAQIEDRT